MGTDGTGKAYSLKFAKQSISPRKTTHVNVHRGSNRGGMPNLGRAIMPMQLPFQQPKTNWIALALGFVFGGLTGFIGGGGTSNKVTNTTGSSKTTSTQTNNYEQQLANLKTLYPKYNIVSDGDGKFRATDSDGNYIGSGTYDEMCNLLASQQTNKQTVEEAREKEDGNGSNSDTDIRDEDVKAATASNTTGSSGKVKVPNGWYRADTQSNEGKNLKLSDCKTAREVLNKILSSKMDYLSTQDRDRLLTELIKYNPSVFESNGDVKQDADFDKLDVPSINYIKTQYINGDGTYNSKTGAVTYNSKKDGQVSGQSTINDQHNNIVRGKNGYYVKRGSTSQGNTYYNNKGQKIDGDEFKKYCPNIYKIVNQS